MSTIGQPRRRIADEHRAAAARIVALERALDVLLDATGDSPDDEHDPEGATIGFERAQAASLLAASRAHREELEAALQRIDHGSYGACTACDGPIAAARLDALPATRTCIACAGR